MKSSILACVIACLIPLSALADPAEENAKLLEQAEKLDRRARTLEAAIASIKKEIARQNVQISRLGGKPVDIPAPVAPVGDEAKQVFDSLFAPKIKAVTATADRADDITLAKEILALAKTSTTQPGLLAILCDSAHDLSAKHTDGLTTAIESQQLLGEHIEEKRDVAREKLTILLTRQSTIGKPEEREAAGESLIDMFTTMGDEKAEAKMFAEAALDYRRAITVAAQRSSSSLDAVKTKLDFVTSRDRTMKNVSRLQEKLLEAADRATAEELVKLFVIELDDPAGAAPFLDRVNDPAWNAAIPLAQKESATLTAPEALALGDFYTLRAKEAPASAKPTMWNRARDAYVQFLALHEARDLSRTKVEVTMKEIEESLGSAGGELIRGEVDVLRLIDAKRDGMAGVTSEGGKLVMTADKVTARFFVPVAMSGAYELRVVFTRKAGMDDFSIALPVGGQHILHVVDGWGSSTAALHCSGERQHLTSVKTGPRIVNGKNHTLIVTVTPDEKGQVRIQSRLDDKPLLEWKGGIGELVMHPEEYPGHPSNLVVRCSQSVNVIKEFKIKVITGKLEPTEHLYITARWGGQGGGRFVHLGPKGSMLVGLRGTAGKFLQSLQPIYRTATEVIDGPVIRNHPDTRFEVIAREGYAIGGINIRTGKLVDGFEVVFMKVKGSRLDPNDSYKSPWVGGRGGAEATFAGDGNPFVGIHGGTGSDFDGFGVIIRR